MNSNVKTSLYEKFFRLEDKVSCRLCGKLTPMLGTKLCDRCWELESRIKHNPELARKILEQLEK